MSGRPAVCKFFKQGNCQYGSNCRFFHPQQSNNNNNYNTQGAFGNSGFNNNGYNNGGNSLGGFASQGTTQQVQETVQQFCNPSSMSKRETEIRNDMTELAEMLELSNGIFTCYSLKPPATTNLISNRDLSYEEARIQYYVAQSSNSIPQLQQELNMKYQDMNNCVSFLKNNTQKSVRYLQLALQNPNVTPKPLIPPFDPTSTNSAPGASAGNSIFGSVTANSNPFNSTSNTTSAPAFGSTNNPFGGVSAATKSNPFGGVSASKPNPFGNASASTPNPFGGATASGGAFGASGFGNSLKPTGGAFGSQASTFGTSTTTGGAFGNSGFGSLPGGTSTTNTTNPFGSSPFGASATSNPFGSSTTPATNPATSTTAATTTSNSTSSPFGTAFGSSTTATGAFGSTGFGSSTAASNPFGNTNNGGFGSTLTTTSTTTTTNNNNFFQGGAQPSPFGGFAGNNNGFASSSQGVSVYKQAGIDEPLTKMEDLGQEIINIFEAATFEIGKVPDIPPPLELC